MNRTILIVDNSPADRSVLDRFLRDEYTVVQTAAGGEALALLCADSARYSAVVSELSLPDMDGFQLLKTIRETPMLASLPVVAATVSDNSETHEQALACGANGFVVKPYRQSLLLHVLRNAIRLRETAATLSELQRDRLTGVYTREAFLAIAGEKISKHPAGFYIMAYININSFKVINDQHGTDVGDQVLRHLAGALDAFASAVRGICGRIMADQFALLYPATEEDAPRMAQCHRDAAAPSCLPRQVKQRVGRYHIDNPALSVNAILDRAIIACNAIHSHEDVSVNVYTEEMRQNILREQEIVSKMHDALACGQFEVWLQPQINHTSGALIGAEALARWRTTEGTLISPKVFVPIFEKNGFIYEVDKYIWEQVCRLLRRWLDEGKTPVPISVNISRYDILHDDLTDTLRSLVERYGLTYDLLRLEITESAFTEASGRIIAAAKELIALGFILEIDDFGSGYSSLNTLKDVPANVLKLDMRFFENTDDSQRSGNIVESVARMAKWIGMSIIAEGVEAKDQADFLETIGCVCIQGYYYSRPIPITDFETFMHGRQMQPRLDEINAVDSYNNSSFWNPKSLDTMVFNHFSGGAFIFESYQGKYEMLRVNKEFPKTFNSPLSVREILRLEPFSRLAEAEKRIAAQTVEQAYRSGQGEVCELYSTMYCAPGQGEYIRVTVRRIAEINNRQLYYGYVDNITDRWEAQKKERELQSRLSTVLNHVNGGITAVYLEGDRPVIAFSNDQYYEQLGYTKTQFEAEVSDAFDIVPEGDRARVREQVRQISQTGVPASFEYQCRRRDGSLIYVRCSATLTHIEGYDQNMLVSVVTDITELIESKLETEKVSSQLQAIMENMEGGVCASVFCDGKSQYLFANRKYYEQLGYTRKQYDADFTGEYIHIHPDDRARAMATVAQNNDYGSSYSIEFRILTADGETRWIVCNASVIRLIGVPYPVHLSVATDVTARRKAEQERLESIQKLKAIMDNMTGGVAAAKFDPGGGVSYSFNNDHFYDLFGYTKQEAEARKLHTMQLILHEDLRVLLPEVRRIVLTEHKPYTCEFRCRKKDGSIAYMHCNISLADIAGIGSDVVIFVINDITEHKLLARTEQILSTRVKALMDNTSCGITAVILDQDSIEKVLFVNDKFYELVGYTRQSYREAGHHGLSLMEPEDYNAFRASAHQLTEIGMSASYEVRVRHRDGRVRWLRSDVSVIRLAEIDQPVQLACYTDITERVEAAQNALASSAKFHAILDNLSSAVYVGKLDNATARHVFSNNKFYELVGYAWETYPHDFSVVRSLIHPDDRNRVLDAVHRVMDTGGILDIDYRFGCGDGRIKWFHHRSVSTSIPGIGTRVQLSIIDDITKQKEAQLSEKQTAEKLRTVLANIGSGVAAVVLEPRNARLLFSNDQLYEVLGVTRARFESMPLRDLISLVEPADLARVQDALRSVRRTKKPATVDYRTHRMDGTAAWIRTTLSLTTLTGIENPVQIFVCTDITQEKTAVEQIEFINTLAGEILSQPYNDKAIDAALTRLMHYNDADRAYIVELDQEKQQSSSTYEVCAPGVTAQKGSLQQVAFDRAAPWMDALEQNRPFVIADVEALADAALQKQLQMKCIRSLAIVPLTRDDRLIGFAGVDNPRRHVAQISRIHAPADYLSTLLYRRDLLETLRQETREALDVMNGIPGGFTRLQVQPDRTLKAVFFSEGYLRLVDMSQEALNELHQNGVMSMLHPKDVPMIEAAITRILDGETLYDVSFRLRHGSEGYIRVSAFSNLHIDRTGRQYINVFYSDLTEREELNAQRELMLQSIPGGIAVYSVSVTGITMLYFNDGFFKYSGYTREEYLAITRDNPLGLLFAEDRPSFRAMLRSILNAEEGTVHSSVYRCHTKEGGFRWMKRTCRLTRLDEESAALHVVQVDITDRMEYEEQLKRRELEYQAAISHSGRVICRFDRQAHTLTLSANADSPTVFRDFPEQALSDPNIAPETRDAYLSFYRSIAQGDAEAAAVFLQHFPTGWRWIEAHATSIFSADGAPSSAIVSYLDVTEQQEKEAIYKKWQQALIGRDETTYALYQVNLNKNNSYDSRRGTLFTDTDVDAERLSFGEHTRSFAEHCIAAEDRARFLLFLDSDALLAGYYRGVRALDMDFRSSAQAGSRWTRLSVELVEYPNSTDIEAYLMFEDIHEAKLAELWKQELAENDPLTGIANRKTFFAQADDLICKSSPGAVHAFLMMDIDSFKQYNDTFGHSAGDDLLTETAQTLKSLLRGSDLLGRLGGDEYVIFLTNIRDRNAAAAKADQICKAVRKADQGALSASISVGISLYPADATNADALYRTADCALYSAKGEGKNTYCFYSSHLPALTPTDERPNAPDKPIP